MIILNQFPHTISGDFVKETRERTTRETISGIFYAALPHRVLFWVHDPVNQIFTFNQDTLILYYPDEKKAFKIKTSNPLTLDTQWGLNREPDFSKLGYLFTKKIQSGDTLYSYWISKGKSEIGSIVVGRFGDRIVFIEVKDNDQKLLAKTSYLNYLNYEDIYIPTQIHSFNIINSDTLEESISYDNIQFDIELPDSILNFRIPEGTEIKEVEW